VPEVGLEPTLPGGNRILSPPCSRTGADTQGQGATIPRFYRGFGLPKGTGKDRERHPVAVRLRSKVSLRTKHPNDGCAGPPCYVSVLRACSLAEGSEKAAYSFPTSTSIS
jgi:hypothetical protein